MCHLPPGTGKAGRGGAGKDGIPGEDVPNAVHIAIRGHIEQTRMDAGPVPRGAPAWEYLTSPRYPTVPALRARDAIDYACTEMVVDEDVELVMAIGGGDDTRLWLNDRLVWQSRDCFKPWHRSPGYVGMHTEIAGWNLAEGRRKLRFTKGRNRLLLKRYNGASLAFFSVVILGEGQRQ